MNYSQKLSDCCAGISLDATPPEVIHKAKLCVLDCVANMLGSRSLGAVRNVAAMIRDRGERERATALGWGFRTSVHYAAFINGTAAEAIEAQDGLRFGGNHPGAAVIPASFAVAEEEERDGKAFLEAVIAGYEAANRPAAAMHPWHTLSGFLPTGTCGSFGAAIAAAKLYRLDRMQTLHALGNAGYLTPVSMAEQLMGGYTVKVVQGGQAAGAGIMAAQLARTGITGHPRVLEGTELKGGFTQITTSAEPNMAAIDDGLGSRFTIMDVYFKPYTSCRHTHGAIEASKRLKKRHAIVWDDVDRIEVFTYGIAVLAVGKGMEGEGSFVSAQFSIPYCVAATLIDGDMGPAQLGEDRLSDPRILGLAKKVSIVTDDELNGLYPDKTATRVEIVMKDGTRCTEQVAVPKGDPRDPLEEQELIEKVKNFAETERNVHTDELIERIQGLEKLRHIGKLAECL